MIYAFCLVFGIFARLHPMRQPEPSLFGWHLFDHSGIQDVRTSPFGLREVRIYCQVYVSLHKAVMAVLGFEPAALRLLEFVTAKRLKVRFETRQRSFLGLSASADPPTERDEACHAQKRSQESVATDVQSWDRGHRVEARSVQVEIRFTVPEPGVANIHVGSGGAPDLVIDPRAWRCLREVEGQREAAPSYGDDLEYR
jgi:hypothetical protein